MTTIFTVAFIPPAVLQPDTDDVMSFVFTDRLEAIQFSDHLRDYYTINAPVLQNVIDTYDSAIQAVVDAIGPSED